MAQGRVVVACRSGNRVPDRYAPEAFVTRDADRADPMDGLVSISGLLVRVAIASVLVVAMFIATNLMMLRWLS